MLRNILDVKWNSLLKMFPKKILLLVRGITHISWISNFLSFIYHPLDTSRLVEYPFAFKHLTKSKRELILDIGSGISCFPSFLVRRGFSVVVSDIDKESLTLQQKSGKELLSLDSFDRLGYVLADARALPFRPMSFGEITCISTIEHINEDVKAIKEIYRVTKKNGKCILSFPYSLVMKKAITTPFFMRFYNMNDIKVRFLRPTKFKITEKHIFGKKILRFGSLLPGDFKVGGQTFHFVVNLIIGLFLYNLEDILLKCDQDAGGCLIVLKRPLCPLRES